MGLVNLRENNNIPVDEIILLGKQRSERMSTNKNIEWGTIDQYKS